MPKKITIALAGNPNSGKSSVFNNLTGAHQHVGNYPGVTVEKKEGVLAYKGHQVNVVDLPGTYSLSAYSIDEIVARSFLIEEAPDVVIDIIDSSNLERNLYLAVQIMELGIPLVLAFNMHDLSQKQGLQIDRDKLSELLGSPIVFTVATKKRGMDELVEEAIKIAGGARRQRSAAIGYGKEIEEEIAKLEELIARDKNLVLKFPVRWLATKLLEDDSDVVKRVMGTWCYQEIIAQAQKSIGHLKGVFGDTPESVIADRRYGFISGACSEAARRTYEVRHSVSDKIDNVVANKILGLPILLGLMWLVFKFTFTFSEPMAAGIESMQARLGAAVGGFLPQGSVIRSLAVEGIIGGVGSVLVFVPMIFLLFLALAFLEDSGYMARAAFIMDRLMHKIGLHGRSFIPMLLGFGCNVPAILATRSIRDRRARFVTMLIIPFMSCGARLPIYTLFVGAFFAQRLAGNVLFSLYFLGIAVAIIIAKLLRKYIFKGEAAAFVMELPAYRIPTLKGLLLHMWARGSAYLKKAGTVIFVGCILVWFLGSFPRQAQDPGAAKNLEQSYLGRIGKGIEPVFRPLGFGQWRIGVGLIGGLVAKEVLVGTLGTLYSVGEVGHASESLRRELRGAIRPDGSKLFTPLSSFSLMVFVLLYMPCIAVIAVIKKETDSWRWPVFTAIYTTLVAWIASFIVYQGGRLLGL
ncbi:ferrous iron transport protein B [Candidatus Omnitrophota bacterium]